MGAPKQKWTSDEESALKAGVVKHGAGKWRTILKDPEYSGVLYLRSNVDLKDKWRNMGVIANGWGSREKARLAVRRMHRVSKQDDNSTSSSSDLQSDEDMEDDNPVAASSGSMQIDGPRRSIISRLDNLIIEAISSLDDPRGSNKTTISAFIEEQYWAPPNFRRLLSGKLKNLTTNGRLTKVKRKYRIPPTHAFSDKRRIASMSLLMGTQVSPNVDRDEIDTLTKSQIDMELENMRTMTAPEAAAAAARAVAEAEAAEADAEAAQAFAEAAWKTLKGNPPNMIVQA